MLLTAEDRDKMADDVGELIAASSETAELIRPGVSGAGSFAGTFESSESSLGVVPIEFKQLSPEELKQLGVDGVCSLPPASGIQENDIIVYQGARYRATEVKPENCFGVFTHLTVKLERIYQA
jgi:hypothetical protein